MHSRNIKIGFFRNENLGNCDPLARLLFVGMWCVADREGRMEDRPGRIAAEALPFDGVKPAEAERLVAQLAAERDPHDPTAPALIHRYRVGDKNYIQIVNFTKHQKPHHTEGASKLPPCEIPAQPNGEQTGSERGDNGEQTVDDPLVSSLDSLDSQNPKYPPYSPPKGDGAGEEQPPLTLAETPAVTDTPKRKRSAIPAPTYSPAFERLWAKSPPGTNFGKASASASCEDLIAFEGLTWEELERCVDRYVVASAGWTHRPHMDRFFSRKAQHAGKKGRLFEDYRDSVAGGTQVAATAESEEKRQGRLAREKWEAEHGVPVWR